VYRPTARLALNAGMLKGVRGVASSGVTMNRGAAAIATGSVSFGSINPLNNSLPWTMWVYVKPAVTNVLSLVFGGVNNTWANGYGIALSAAAKVVYLQNDGTGYTTNVTSESYDTTWQTIMAACRPTVAWDGVWRNGIPMTLTLTRNASSSYSPFYMGAAGGLAGYYSGLVGGILLFRGSKPQGLADILDLHPDLFWWWPGKSGVFYSVGGPVNVTLALSLATASLTLSAEIALRAALADGRAPVAIAVVPGAPGTGNADLVGAFPTKPPQSGHVGV
jgi:hypothetical protein